MVWSGWSCRGDCRERVLPPADPLRVRDWWSGIPLTTGSLPPGLHRGGSGDVGLRVLQDLPATEGRSGLLSSGAPTNSQGDPLGGDNSCGRGRPLSAYLGCVRPMKRARLEDRRSSPVPTDRCPRHPGSVRPRVESVGRIISSRGDTCLLGEGAHPRFPAPSIAYDRRSLADPRRLVAAARRMWATPRVVRATHHDPMGRRPKVRDPRRPRLSQLH